MDKKIILLKIIIIILLLALININLSSLIEASINNNDSPGNDTWLLSYIHDNRNTGYYDCKMSSSIKYKWSLNSPGDSFSGKVAILNGTVFTTSMLYFGTNKGEIEIITNGGDKNIPVSINIIDDTPPELIIDYPENNFKTKDNSISISGRAIDDESGIKKITINGKEVEFDDDGYFESDSLSLDVGTNKFTIIATNNVDLSTKVEILVLRDIEPPILTILNLGDNEIVYTPTITISGYAIDQDSGVSEVLINNERVNISIDGKFEKKMNLTPGVNPFYIKATDNVGNETSKLIAITYKVRKIIIITLTIGDRLAFINDEPHILDSPPIIRNGRTLVPIRFIAEAFGAKVDFIPHPTNEVQIRYKDKFIHLWINSKKAKIEYPPELEIPSKVVTLETPPIIINGRTLVPLRFIGEELGAKVDWNSKTQTITLTLEETI